jgi:F0F1-type ATP synthase membrane subunit b/b'
MIREIFHDPELAVAVAFIIAIVLTARRVWDALSGMLDARAAKIKAELDEAQQLKDDAQKTLGQFQRKQRDALQEAEATAASALPPRRSRSPRRRPSPRCATPPLISPSARPGG